MLCQSKLFSCLFTARPEKSSQDLARLGGVLQILFKLGAPVAGRLFEEFRTVQEAAATSAASDEIRPIAALASHVRQQATPTGHASASHKPRKVATPLPPLNPSQTGKQ